MMKNEQASGNQDIWLMGIPKSERKYYIPAIIGVVFLCASFFFDATFTDAGQVIFKGLAVPFMGYAGYLNYRRLKTAWADKRIGFGSVCISMFLSGLLVGIFFAQFILTYLKAGH